MVCALSSNFLLRSANVRLSSLSCFENSSSAVRNSGLSTCASATVEPKASTHPKRAAQNSPGIRARVPQTDPITTRTPTNGKPVDFLVTPVMEMRQGIPANGLGSHAIVLACRAENRMCEYQLYCFAKSGNSYRAALMLNLICADWKHVVVDFFTKGEPRTSEYRSNVNEMGEVPVLVHGAKKLSQSGVILTYLAERSGKFQPNGADERLEALRWIIFDNQKVNGFLGPYR